MEKTDNIKEIQDKRIALSVRLDEIRAEVEELSCDARKYWENAEFDSFEESVMCEMHRDLEGIAAILEASVSDLNYTYEDTE